jgi:hypothetical protein
MPRKAEPNQKKAWPHNIGAYAKVGQNMDTRRARRVWEVSLSRYWDRLIDFLDRYLWEHESLILNQEICCGICQLSEIHKLSI